MKLFLLIIMILQVPTIMCKTFGIFKITQNGTEQKKLIFCFWVINDHYYHFFSRGKTTPNFEIFVQLPKFVRS